MLSLASAIYPGETQEITSNLDYIVNYTIFGNLSTVQVIISQNKAYLTIPTDYIPSNFTLEFYGFNGETQIIHSGGGGGSKTKYVNVTKVVPLTEYLNNTQEVNNTIYLEKNISSPPEITNKIPKPLIFLIGFLLIVLVILIIWQYKVISDYQTAQRLGNI